MDFRQYDNAIGRFTSIDALADIPEQMDKTPYAFSWNNPVVFNDPTGLCPECPTGAKNGDTYVSNGGVTYVYGEGGWTGQGGELDEVVITPNKKPEPARNYGGDGSGDAGDTTMKVLDGINKFNPIANLWDVLSYTFTGEDRLGNKMSTFQASVTAVSVAPVFRGLSFTSSAAMAEAPSAYSGVRAASAYLQSQGVIRAERKAILQSFQIETIALRTANNYTFGLRFFGGASRASGRYLFPTFTNSVNRVGLALPYSWNSMSGIMQYQVSPGSIYIFGRAASQGGYYTGGSYQMFVNNLMNLK